MKRQYLRREKQILHALTEFENITKFVRYIIENFPEISHDYFIKIEGIQKDDEER